MSILTLEIVRYCAEEVDRQGRGPIQVFNMLDAWQHAICSNVSLCPMNSEEWRLHLLRWAHLVEPTQNPWIERDIERTRLVYGGWRKCNVRVGSRCCPNPAKLPGLLKELVERFDELPPEEAYREFELIHPFVDGNGRVGKILMNALKGTLEHPVMPPNYFSSANP